MQDNVWHRWLAEDSRLVERGWVDRRLWQAQVARARFGVFNGIASFDFALVIEGWLRTLEMHSAPPVPELQAAIASE